MVINSKCPFLRSSFILRTHADTGHRLHQWHGISRVQLFHDYTLGYNHPHLDATQPSAVHMLTLDTIPANDKAHHMSNFSTQKRRPMFLLEPFIFYIVHFQLPPFTYTQCSSTLPKCAKFKKTTRPAVKTTWHFQFRDKHPNLTWHYRCYS